MPTGDFPCDYCGSYYCGQGDLPVFCDGRLESMSAREKRPGPYRPTIPRLDPFDLQGELDQDIVQAKDASKDDLIAFLTAYLGDAVFAKRFADCISLIKAKNADYTQGTAKRDRIAAFRRISGDIGVPMEKVWAIFCQKHWGAVMKFVKDGQVESEPIDGRINDIINYMVLLGAIIDDGKSG